MKITLLLFLISFGAFAAPTNSALDEFFKDKTRIQNPLELRDPFKSPQAKGQRMRQGGNRFSRGGGLYSNLEQQSMNDWNVYEIRVVGVMIGKERRAMVTRGDGKSAVIVIKEGARIGPDNAEVKAILPGGIILVEKIINVYGQEEYLETVVPISR